MDDLLKMRQVARRLGQTEVVERPGISGTWTPTLVGATIAGTFTYNAVTGGTWTRIGDLVFLRGRVTITAVTVAPTGNLSIRGLPFTAASPASAGPGQLTFTYWSTIGIGGGANVYLAGWIRSATTQADLVVSQNGGGGAAILQGVTAGVAANTDLIFAGQMEI